MFFRAKPFLAGVACAAATVFVIAARPAGAKEAADLAGPWTLAYDKTGAACPVLLRAQRSDKGDYFLGMPTACRHAMPGIAAVGRWAAPDDAHLTLDDPSGAPLLNLTRAGDGYTLSDPTGTYMLTPSALHPAPTDPTGPAAPEPAAKPPAAAKDMAASAPAPKAALIQVAARHGEATETAADLAGRYAVMRETRDTGCMLTLDRAHVKGGDRAQLAPGCRDQGIVVFDPSAWQVTHGTLVLTARAGHKTKLEKQGEGLWQRDASEGKPLGLKKL